MRRVACLSLIFVLGLRTLAYGQSLPPNMPNKEQLANDNNLFHLISRSKLLHWEEPTKPIRDCWPDRISLALRVSVPVPESRPRRATF